jgi:hypothetical protein
MNTYRDFKQKAWTKQVEWDGLPSYGFDLMKIFNKFTSNHKGARRKRNKFCHSAAV